MAKILSSRSSSLFLLMTLTFVFLCSCNTRTNNKTISFNWLGKEISLPNNYGYMNKYIIKDSLDNQIGSMVFYTQLRDNKVISVDTSKFDDGSIYETASMTYDLEMKVLSSLTTKIKTETTSFDIDLNNSTQRIQGHYRLNRNGENIVDKRVDSIIPYDIFREEIYMLANLLPLNNEDRINFTVLFSDNLQTTSASLFHESFQKVKVPVGEFQTKVWYLDTGGIIDNRIWVNSIEPGQIVKFYIPDQGLSIELVDNRRIN